MTACVNSNQKREGARRAVGATLAGMLAVGMVPAAAFADDADEAAAEDEGIESLATDADAFKAGTVAYEKGADGDEYAYNGKAQGLVPETVTPVTAGAKAIDVAGLLPAQDEREEGSVYYYYVKLNNSGSQIAPGVTYTDANGAQKDIKGDYVTSSGSYVTPTEAGTYAVVVGMWNGSVNNWDYVSTAATFKIVSESLSGATAYEEHYDSDNKLIADTSDTTFNWTGAEQKVGFTLDGVALKAGEDYTVAWYGSNGATPMTAAPTLPGTYYASLTGVGAYAGSSAFVQVTVGKLDLSTANVTIADTTSGNVSDLVVTADDVDVSALVNVSITNAAYTKNGAYTATVTAKTTGTTDGTEGGTKISDVITGSKSGVSFKRVGEVALFKYNGENTTAESPYTVSVDLSDADVDEQYFDASLISVTKVDGTAVGKKQYSISYTDEEGNAATADDLKTPGTWYAVVTVNDSTYALGGTAKVKVVVTNGTIAASGTFVSFDGENVAATGYETTYTGEDLLPGIDVTVRAAGKTLVSGTDYTVKFTDADGEEVAEIVNAGEYTVTITPVTYAGSVQTYEFTVSPIALSADEIRVVNDFTYETTDATTGETVEKGFLSYTGEVLTPTFEYLADDKGDSNPKNDVWKELPAEVYSVTYTNKQGKEAELKNTGTYTATFEAAEDEINFVFDDAAVSVEVSDQKIFADVANTDWYAQVVYTAATNKYMNGYAGTKLFGPNASITRADVACVLFNMAGGQAQVGNLYYDKETGWVTGFDDVDGTMYYARAVAWAKQAGVVNGYGDGTFKPDQTITREEFAAMLANYAKLMGDYEAPAADALAEMPDASSVSDWATEVVGWAVENGVMGNGGFIAPQQDITRAEVAAMAVNYQPEPLKSGLVL